MPIKILTNSAAAGMARVLITNSSDASAGDEAGIEAIIGGPRWLSHTSGATSDRRYVYVNKTAGLSCDYIVMPNMDRHNGHGVTLRHWSTYTSSTTTDFTTSNFAETLYGPTSRDWYRAFSASSKAALGVDLVAGTGGNDTKTVNQIFFSSSYTLSSPGAITRSPLFVPSYHFYRRRMFQTQEAIAFTAENLSRAQVAAFLALPKLREEPCFLLDEDGTRIAERLLHVIITDYKIDPFFDDKHVLSLSAQVLRYHR